MNKYDIVIKCPHCGAEFLPAEVYYPEDFLGEPVDIVKDENGQIVTFDGTNMNLEEEFVCPHCDKSFKVTAKVEFETKKDEGIDFSDEF